MLEACQLTRRYGSVTALDRLDLTVAAGEVFCLLGPNGAGKTTTVNLFLNFVEPSSGEARVDGLIAHRQPLAVRQRLAYIPETVMLHGPLTGLENLDHFATLATGRRWRPADLRGLLDEAGLSGEAQDRRVAGYSKGMRQKVGIAIALAKRARALLLDEPTSGLDPAAASEFAQMIFRLRGEGLAILMVTHDLFLAQRCSDRVGIMQRGRLRTVLNTATVDAVGLEQVYLDCARGAARDVP